jgi:hypothetical protein
MKIIQTASFSAAKSCLLQARSVGFVSKYTKLFFFVSSRSREVHTRDSGQSALLVESPRKTKGDGVLELSYIIKDICPKPQDAASPVRHGNITGNGGVEKLPINRRTNESKATLTNGGNPDDVEFQYRM